MLTPEQERPVSAEQVRQPSFEERLRGLIEPKRDEEGKVLQEAVIKNKKLQGLAQQALESCNQNSAEGLEKLLEKGDRWCLDGRVPEREWWFLAKELDKERERRLKEQEISKEGGVVLEEKAKREALLGQNIEPYLGAVFEKGRYESYIRTGQISRETNIVLDVTNPRERERWLLENVRAAMDGTIPNPEETWKSIVDLWRLDFSEAARREGLSFEEREEFDKEIKSAMAICAAARAMEQSDGAAATYLGFITQSSPDNLYLDRQDDWVKYILQGDPDKISSVLENNNLVRFYYEQLLKDVKATKEWDLKEEEREREEEKEELTRDNVLLSFLEDSGRKGGFGGYIDEVLLRTEIGDLEKEGFSRGEKWAAARLACDIFLVDKYTKREYALDKAGDKDLKPSSYLGK